MMKLQYTTPTLKAGFSLPEMIVVVACLAVIVTLSYGDLISMFDKQMMEKEKLQLQEIYKATELYAQNEKTLPTSTLLCDPDDDTSWAVLIAKYSELSASSICFDTWGQRRHYLTRQITQNFNGGKFQYNVYFASVLSEGPDRSKDTVDWTTIKGSNGFTSFDAENDDLVIKYNDNAYKLELYEETLDRIAKLEAALERYGRSKMYSAISADIIDYDNYIVYPLDNRSADPGKYLTTADVGSALDSSAEVATITEELKAVELTKVLGVPEYWGRNALTGESMWYISNPGPDREQPCDGARSVAPYYPPAIFVTTNDILPNGC